MTDTDTQPDPHTYESELSALRRDFFVDLTALDQAKAARTEQYRRARAELAAKYGRASTDQPGDHLPRGRRP